MTGQKLGPTAGQKVHGWPAGGIILFLAFVVFLLAGCTDPVEKSQPPPTIGHLDESINVPSPVSATAKEVVGRLFAAGTADFPDYRYVDWRIQALAHSYTYEEFMGRPLEIYRLNYEFLSAAPEKVVPAGGMYVTEDGWVMPTYPDSTYLVFQREGDTLTFLDWMMVNDSHPGEPLFDADLGRLLAD